MTLIQATMEDPAGGCAGHCAWCGEPFDHGCNTGLCSAFCEDELRMVHERAHAGTSDVDDCNIDDCPLLVLAG